MQRLKTPERRDPFADVGSRVAFEFGGTFFLCLCYAIVEPASRPVALACGIIALVYAGAHVSGGHCNPAVSMAVWMAARQEFNFANMILYVGTQIAGAVAAGKVAQQMVLVEAGGAGSSCAAPYPSAPVEACVQTSDCTACPDVPLETATSAADCASAGCTYTAAVDSATSFGAEVIGVAVLCFVLLHTTTTRGSANNSFFGIAVGFSALSALTSFGGMSGGAFNPAVAMLYVSYPTSETLPSDGIGRFWTAGLLGGAIAAALFRFTALPSEFRRANAEVSYCYQGKIGASISTAGGHYLMELIGTTYLALVVSILRAGSSGDSTAAPSTAPLAALTLGAAYTAMVAAGGHSSGGHYSPSLSIALMIRSLPAQHGLSVARAFGYVAMQVLGGFCGGWLAKYLGQSGCLTPPSAAITDGNGSVWAAESLGSGLLVFIVCHVATLQSTSGNSYFPMATGFTFSLCTMVFSGSSPLPCHVPLSCPASCSFLAPRLAPFLL
jgi:aquaporin Z